LLAAIRDPDPVVFLEPKRIYRLVRQEVADDGEALPLDVGFVLREGSDLTLVSWGAMMQETLQVVDMLDSEGISAEVIDVATIKPLDMGTILESTQKTGRCVIVHEAAGTCGVGGRNRSAIGRARLIVAVSTRAAGDRLRHGDAAFQNGGLLYAR
jgi:pyruvate dehydrogenase E1 component beta subunit